mgnify:FL=1
MRDIIVPIGICVVLPVMLVWLVTRVRRNEIDKKTEVMLKAIESGATIDSDFFKEAPKKRKSTKERLLNRLICGCAASIIGAALTAIGIIPWMTLEDDTFAPLLIFGGISLAVGIALFIGFFVGRKMLAKEMEAEEKSLEQE